MNRLQVLVELHEGLPQQGPGSDASSARAFALLPRSPATILDLGCGPGRQTLALARLCDAEITAVDLSEPFLDDLRRRASAAGLEHRIRTLRESMLASDLGREPVDLIWSEGAAYNVGVRRALDTWRRFLREDGCVAFTELTWLVAEPPAIARAYWSRYPAMTSIEENLATADALGYTQLGHFVLPESDWWEGYYVPLEARCAEVRARYADVPDALPTIQATEQEVALYREHSGAFGYVFYVLRR